MYCPQCGTQADETQQFCRKCGANLKMIAKAVKVTESIGRSDRGPIPVIRNLIDQIKSASNLEDVHTAVDKMGDAIDESLAPHQDHHRFHVDIQPKSGIFRRKTPAERHAKQIERGMTSIFGGLAFMIVAYFFARDAILQIPPHIADQIPFDLQSWIPIFWMLGLLPLMTGIGRLIAAAMTREDAVDRSQIAATTDPLLRIEAPPDPVSVTEHTTHFLDREEPDDRSIPKVERQTQ